MTSNAKIPEGVFHKQPLHLLRVEFQHLWSHPFNFKKYGIFATFSAITAIPAACFERRAGPGVCVLLDPPRTYHATAVQLHLCLATSCSSAVDSIRCFEKERKSENTKECIPRNYNMKATQ